MNCYWMKIQSKVFIIFWSAFLDLKLTMLGTVDGFNGLAYRAAYGISPGRGG